MAQIQSKIFHYNDLRPLEDRVNEWLNDTQKHFRLTITRTTTVKFGVIIFYEQTIK